MSATAYPSHRRFWTRLFSLALLLAALPAAAQTLFVAEYKMAVGGFTVGKVRRSLSLEDGVYHFRSDARPTGLAGAFIDKTFHEDDRWTLVDGHIRPLRYRYSEKSGDREVLKTNLKFDWSRDTVCDLAREDACWPLTDDSQDPASATFAVMMSAARDRAGLVIHSIGGRMPVVQHYRRQGEGKFGKGEQALRVVKFVQTDDERLTLNAWLAPDRAWLPVFIRQVARDGADTTLSLTHIETLNTAALLRIWAK